MNTKMKNEGEEAETNDRAAVLAEVEKLLQNATPEELEFVFYFLLR